MARVFWVVMMCCVGPSLAAEPKASPPLQLSCPELTESSGLCIDDQGVWWTHNDSGDQPVLYAFDAGGRWLAKVRLQGAEAIDWEDMCCFERDGQHYLAVGDIGDNSADRESIHVYVIRRPPLKILSDAPADDAAPAETQVPCVGHFELRYRTGAVNCESLAYDPLRFKFLLPSKEGLFCRIFEFDAEHIEQHTQIEIEPALQTLMLPLVTGADISRRGDLLVLTTYGPGCLLQRDVAGRWSLDPAQLKMFELPVRRQGESICFSLDARQLYLTSEFAPTPLLQVPTPFQQ